LAYEECGSICAIRRADGTGSEEQITSGEDEVYVQPFPEPGEKWQISSGGGDEPAWARTSNELFYRNGGKMMAAAVRTNGGFKAGKPTALFRGLYHYNIVPGRTYDVAPDGKFVMVKEQKTNIGARQINVVIGWTEELRRRVPPRVQ
jgi:eukaryotic-like serine/threonine-protein kinase